MILGYSENIKNFIKENYYNKKLFSKSFLEEYRQVVLSDFNIDSYLPKINGKLMSTFLLGGSYTYKKDINLYRLGILKNFIVSFPSDLNRDHYIFTFYYTLLHETMHALEHLEKDEVISKIFKQSDEVIFGEHKKDILSLKSELLYTENHDVFPSERLAIMSSLLFLINICEEMHKDRSEMFSYYYLAFMTGIQDYFYRETFTCPLYKFYSIINRVDIFNQFDFSKFTLEQKWIYGMPLTRSEIEQINKPFIFLDLEGKLNIKTKKLAKKEWRI